ncbi:MAG: hypothetical protein ACKV2O_07690 [Acidimicrobiales bacterium]
MVEPYFLLLVVLGVAVIAATVVRRALTGLRSRPPMVYLLMGMALFALPIGIDGPRPGANDEAVVIVSLMGAGLKLNRPPSSYEVWTAAGAAKPPSPPDPRLCCSPALLLPGSPAPGYSAWGDRYRGASGPPG